MRIGINCGHTVSGQPGSGAVGILNESNETREVGKRLMTLLAQNGHTAVDCTNDYAQSTNENLNAIISLANAEPLDLFVSIHFNSGGGKGTEVYTYSGEKYAAAVNVCAALEGLGFVNRGVKDGSKLYVVRKSNAKAMLIEVCFVDTETDASLYRSLGAERIARAICEAITGQEIGNEEELTMPQYEELNERLKKLENPMIYNYIDDNMPSWAHEAVRWCVDKGIIQGTGDGLGLDDTKLWLCTVIYRLSNQLKG